MSANLKPDSSPGTSSPIARPRSAFTLVEIMIAVTLMSVIVLGLMAMFSQTQRAFRLGMNQTDVLESGRLATDMIVREMEQLSPSYKPVNGFHAWVLDPKNVSRQALPGTDALRTNVMSDLFFIARENRTVRGIGYFVRTNAAVPGSFGPVGTLYRFETNNTLSEFEWNPSGLQEGFLRARNNGVTMNVSRIVDGVVHFTVRAFDVNGVWINPDDNRVADSVATNSYWSGYLFNHVNYDFTNNLAPAYLELELGILEQSAYQRYRAMPPGPVRDNFFNGRAGAVHVFRQRIPVRNVDLTAYQ